MSFRPPPNKKGTQSKATASGSASHSGRSSPVIIPRSVSAALPQATVAGAIRDSTQATTRSVSSSHATSHAKAAKQALPPRTSLPTPGRIGAERRSEGTQETVMLNSPVGSATEFDMNPTAPFTYYTPGVQEAYDAAEEQEVYALASPDKDEQDVTPSRQQEDPYHSMDSGRPRRQLPFVTMRQPRPSTMGSQFIPTYRTTDTAITRIEAISDGLGGLREEMKGLTKEVMNSTHRIESSAQYTNNAIERLIREISEDRRERRSASRSSRGRSPGIEYFPLSQRQQERAREEVETEEPNPAFEPTEDVPTEENEAPSEERSQTETLIRQLTSTGELSALIGLQRTELMRSQRQTSQLAYRRGHRETSPNYDTRMNHNARAHVLAELRSGVTPATLFDRLYPSRRQARFEERSNRRQEQTEVGNRQQDVRQTSHRARDGQRGPVNGPSPPPSDSGGGGSSARDQGSPLHRGPRHSSISRAPRTSAYTGSVGRTLTATDRSSERTDEIVRREINDACRTIENRSDAINIGKTVKIPLPEYIGGESIDAFLKFLREFLVYLINFNLMKPEMDAHRVSLLGSALKDRALRWYQHTIHLNADGEWTFELAMIELKRYFVKDVSSRDAATRFDRLTQKNRTVTELKKDLERLSQQMIQTPSDYDMSRRFLNALKPEISGTVVRYGINSENSDIDALFEMAKSVEQGMFYEERQRNEHGAAKTYKESSTKPDGKAKITPRSTTPGSYRKKDQKTPTRNGRELKQIGAGSKQVECFSCKQKGHYSNECPKKPHGRRTANAEQIEEEDVNEAHANAADEGQSDSEEEESFSEREGKETSDEQELRQDDSSVEEDLSLKDWTCAARASALDDDDDSDYIVYREKYPCHENLQDWSKMRGCPCPPNEETLEEEGRSVEGSDRYCLAAYLLDEEEPARSSKVNGQSEEQVAYRQRATKDMGPFKIGDAPKRNFKCLGVIEGYMRINGHKAHVLLDGGSTLDMISANFAAVHKLDMFQLKKPLKLQMATSGSHSIINYGARAELHVGELKEQRYFNVVNLDRYHAILGTPFLKHHEVLLSYAGHGSFKLKGRWFPVMDEEFTRPLSEGRKRSNGDVRPNVLKESHKTNRADRVLRTNEAVQEALSPKRGRDVKVAPDKRAH
ncbi:hypothetical protein AX14_014253 [Amanita brunnescens Koide BX004]|nr:hypothetical protein AX14_014253 [Amanita brunnescens Koide BX004]